MGCPQLSATQLPSVPLNWSSSRVSLLSQLLRLQIHPGSAQRRKETTQRIANLQSAYFGQEAEDGQAVIRGGEYCEGRERVLGADSGVAHTDGDTQTSPSTLILIFN